MVGSFATFAQGAVLARALRLLLLLAVALPAASAAPQVGAQVLRADPALLSLAAQEPEARLDVIVQKLGSGTAVEQMVSSLGGEITKDLHIVNAFAAELPAAAISSIAAIPGVRWMTLDAAVHQNGGPTTTVTWATDTAAPTNAGVQADFNSTPIRAGSYIWFSAVADVSNTNGKPVTLNFDKVQITFTAGGASYKVKAPSGAVTFAPGARAGTSFNEAMRTWTTSAASGARDGVFLSGVAWPVPRDLPGGITSVNWSARFTSDSPKVGVRWSWSAAVYSRLDTNYANLAVKAANTGKQSKSDEPAGTPLGFKAAVVSGARGKGGADYTGAYATAQSTTATTVFKNIRSITNSPHGPNSTFGAAGSLATTFSGFSLEKTPGNAISKVEVVLKAYVPQSLSAEDKLVLTASCKGVTGGSVSLDGSAFAKSVGADNASFVIADISATRRWQWSDFDGCLELTVDQSGFGKGSAVYYDAVGLRVTSTSGDDPSGGIAVRATGAGATSAASVGTSAGSTAANSNAPINPAQLGNPFNRVVRSVDVWNEGPNYLRGAGTTIAVVDSGVFGSDDLEGRIVSSVNFRTGYHDGADRYGHGTFVANIAAGDGTASGGAYAGVAPEANVVNVRVSDDIGMSTESDVVAGLQWINDNRLTYNIKVVNMSLNSAMLVPYHQSPMSAAAEILWFNGVTVVVAAGNNGTANLYPPANDPFVITVGATDDKGTDTVHDDSVATFSAWGTTEGGMVKPDIVAPGRNIISYLPDNILLTSSVNHPLNRVDQNYFRMSGTSMAAPVVAGAAALLLQDEPGLTPDQVKYRLMATANKNWLGYNASKAGAGELDVYAAVHGASTESANVGLPASQLLWSGDEAVTWGSVNWNSVNWNSVNWNSVNWNSVNWNSVNWNSDYWGPR